MTRIRTAKVNFSAGEVTSRLLGRADLRGYENGAARLRNVLIHPTGGASRRPGMAFLSELPGPGRLIPFRFSADQEYLLVFLDRALWVYLDGVLIATVTAPWTGPQLRELAWTQSLDTLMVCHPDMPPQRIQRTGTGTWSIAAFFFTTEASGRLRQAYFRFAAPGVTLTPLSDGGSVRLLASAPIFTTAHSGVRLRLKDKECVIESVSSANEVRTRFIDPLNAAQLGQAEADWQEQAFSAARGWPRTAAFHQNRLAFGGSRDLPNRIWLSRIADYGDFSTPEGLDDEAIEFALAAGDASAIVGLHSAQDLLIFTLGGEWALSGLPLTPESAAVRPHTRIGSGGSAFIPALHVEGATLFSARGGRELREMVYVDLQQIYQTSDLALLAPHLFSEAVDLAYDPINRLLYAAMADGRLATVTLYRSEQVTAWTQQDTDGRVESLAWSGGAIHLLIDRAGRRFLERSDPGRRLDSSLLGQSAMPARVWSGLGHLEGRSLRVLADGIDLGHHNVTQGRITLPRAARRVEAGLGFRILIEPLPFVMSGGEATSQGASVRLVRALLRVEETPAFNIDVGLGLQPAPLRKTDAEATLDAPPPAYSGEVEVRGLGWVRTSPRPLWRIEQDAPYPFTLLSIIQEIKVNDP